MGIKDDFSVRYNDKYSELILGEEITKVIKKDPIIVCIGTDKCIGDSLGPLVGSLLKRDNLPIEVYGTLIDPIHAINIDRKIRYIKMRHPSSFILAIDACIGSKKEVGKIYVRNSPVSPGKGVGKKMKSIGDVSLVGMVDSDEKDLKTSLYNIRLGFIMEMAEKIVESIKIAYDVK
ncbi:spore protease YyaC [Clostridium sp. D2Q-14]|uniref:spore protease YyaC n=1 Tax=Anaeromonas gelatinilytica TaxID=2683194 RepID=UPI00193C02BD|nr:spore protease YyaC [Anaeromonas gelatinilytica]MBS4534782.1 spore protease YyaC [Anaeromonas gelatinilytica]